MGLLRPANVLLAFFFHLFLLLVLHQLELTADNEAHHQVWHQRALGVVHVVSVSQPRLGLAADLALHALLPSRRLQVRAFAKVVDKVLADVATLGNDNSRLRVSRSAGRPDANDGRLAEGVDLFKLGGRQHGLLVAVEDFELVGDAELLEKPYDALRARLLEPAGALAVRTNGK